MQRLEILSAKIYEHIKEEIFAISDISGWHKTLRARYVGVFFSERWNWWCLVTYSFVLYLSIHLTSTSLSPAIPPDLSHIPPSSPFLLLPSSPLDISFSLPAKEEEGLAADPARRESMGAQTAGCISRLSPATKFRETQTSVAPSTSARISQLVQKIISATGETDWHTLQSHFYRQPGKFEADITFYF